MVNVAQIVAAVLRDEATAVTVVAGTALVLYLITSSRRAAGVAQSQHKQHAGNPNLPIRTFASLPTPASTLPIIGNLLDGVYFQKDRLYDWMYEQHAIHKSSFRIILPGAPPTMVVATPALFEDVLKTHYASFPKGDDLTYIFRDVFGHGILAVNGDEWFAKRKAASQMFSFQMLNDTMLPIVHAKAQRMSDVLRLYEARNEPTSLKRVLNHYTMDVFARAGFGVDLNCLENGLDGDSEHDFAHASRIASQGLQRRFHEPMWFWRLKRWLNVGSERLLRDNIAFVDALVYDIIQSYTPKQQQDNAVQQPESESEFESEAPAAPRDLISIFLETNAALPDDADDATRAQHAQAIRDSVVNFIFAGADTSAVTMSYLIVMLNRYPRVLIKIRNELDARFPTLRHDDAAMPTRLELQNLPYLEASIRENLRLNGPAAIITRTACEDVVMSDGTFVPHGTRIFMAFYAAMRSTDVWGDDALEFKPERFLDPVTGELVVESPFKLPSFLGGPRACIGMKLAMMEMKCALAVLLSRFDLKTVDDPWTITYEIAIAVGVKGPLLVEISSLKKAQEDATNKVMVA